MPTHKDRFPVNHAALHEKAQQTVHYLMNTENRNRMGFAPDTPQGEWLDSGFGLKYAAFIEACRKWENPATRTRLANVDLTGAQKEFETVYRRLYSGFLRQNPLVTETDLNAMGFPVRKEGRRRRVPVPDTHPVATVHLPSPGVVELRYIDRGTRSRAKPNGVHCAEIAWIVSDIPPQTWKSLTNISVSIQTPFRLSFEFDAEGKKLCFALRWENTRGEKGPWSPIRSTVIA